MCVCVGGDSGLSVLNVVSERPKRERAEIIIWLNPSLSKIESGILFRRTVAKEEPVQLCCLKTRGLNLGVPEFSFERNEMVNALIKKKGNG